MLEYTRLMLKKTIGDIKTFTYILGIATQIFSLAYLIYATVTGTGNIIANIVLLAVSAVYFGIYIALYDAKERKLRSIRSVGKHVSAAIKLGIKAATLCISLYGIYIAAKEASLFTMFFAAGMAVFWLLQVLVELLSYYIESRYEFFMAAIEADIEFITKPLGVAKNVIRRATGQQIEPAKEPNKYRRKLDREIGEIRDERRRAQDEKKRQRDEERTRRRAELLEKSVFGRIKAKRRATAEQAEALPEHTAAADEAQKEQDGAPIA